MIADPISRPSLTGEKRPLESVSVVRRLRSKIPRRRRVPLLPIVSNSIFIAELKEEESSSSCLHSEVSFDPSLGFTASEAMTKRPRPRPRPSRAAEAKSKKPAVLLPEQKQNPGDQFRRITRSYAKKQQLMLRSDETGGDRATAKRSELEIQISEVYQLTEGSTATATASNLNENAEKFPQISESSCLDSISDGKSTKTCNSVVDQSCSRADDDDDNDDDVLACSERISDTECSEYSADEMTLSEIESELFSGISQRGCSDSSISVLESPNYFTEGSDDSTSSAAFSLFLQLAKQLVRSSSSGLDSKHKLDQVDSWQDFSAVKFEELEDEESYRSIRSRERREVVLHNFGEEYSSGTDYGDRILQQRLLMVNWMIEHFEAVELHHETLFLGVSLMDRFLCRGYFKSEKNLQLLGIASITLATRLEEVQPWNSIRRRSFTVGSNNYSRSEVVAMEWLLLEVLNFQCMLPTSHNFLWFYLKAAKADVEMETLTRYLAVLSLLDHERLSFWPSTVAAGLVILACLAINRDTCSLRVMETHVRCKSDDLAECIQSLEWLVKYTQ